MIHRENYVCKWPHSKVTAFYPIEMSVNLMYFAAVRCLSRVVFRLFTGRYQWFYSCNSLDSCHNNVIQAVYGASHYKIIWKENFDIYKNIFFMLSMIKESTLKKGLGLTRTHWLQRPPGLGCIEVKRCGMINDVEWKETHDVNVLAFQMTIKHISPLQFTVIFLTCVCKYT